MFFTYARRTFEVWAAGDSELVWYREVGQVAYLGTMDSALRYARRRVAGFAV